MRVNPLTGKRRLKPEPELTEEDKKALDDLVRIDKLRRTTENKVRRVQEDLDHLEGMFDVLSHYRENAKQKIIELGLEENYKQRCYIEGLIRGL